MHEYYKVLKKPYFFKKLEITSFFFLFKRFVNFITEPYQKSLFAKAIRKIANEVRIKRQDINNSF
jgi:hypothetical protein